ncbi:MAG TPA: AraC family transcriptional regulator [Trebonia sp.]|jgi:AraC-like DNA-binding protein|nr:AraC family transcriptional regulator [Trebonia sp.]
MSNIAIDTAIECIWDRYSEPLSLDEIARSARLSRFYFTRLFRGVTGITPGRFLAAVRVYQAKRLLETTALSVADVSCAVGYASLGSFASCFTASVGLSPGRFRRLAQAGGPDAPGPRPGARPGLGAVAGTVALPEGYAGARVYVGAFATPVVQYPAAAAVVVDVAASRPSCYYLPNVPDGTWFVRAVGMADSAAPERRGDLIPLVATLGPAVVGADSVTGGAMRLRRGRRADPPVLLALPDLAPPATGAAGCPAITPRQLSARA